MAQYKNDTGGFGAGMFGGEFKGRVHTTQARLDRLQNLRLAFGEQNYPPVDLSKFSNGYMVQTPFGAMPDKDEDKPEDYDTWENFRARQKANERIDVINATPNRAVGILIPDVPGDKNTPPPLNLNIFGRPKAPRPPAPPVPKFGNIFV